MDKYNDPMENPNVTWTEYSKGGLDVIAATAVDQDEYEKVVIYLHGGGLSAATYLIDYFGDLSGLKIVFPTSYRDGGAWYETFKNDCGLEDACSVNVDEVNEIGASVAELVDYEKELLGGDGSKVYLAGFSQGGRMVYNVQLGQLNYALGGAFVLCGFPQIPMLEMATMSDRKAK